MNTQHDQLNSVEYEQTRNLFLEALFFEHWARYYYFKEIENTDNAIIFLPQIIYEQCQNKLIHLQALLDSLQNSPINLDNVRTNLFNFIAQKQNLSNETLNIFAKSLATDTYFNKTLNQFYGFVQEQADKDSEIEDKLNDEEYKNYKLNQEIPFFTDWIQKFHSWTNKL